MNLKFTLFNLLLSLSILSFFNHNAQNKNDYWFNNTKPISTPINTFKKSVCMINVTTKYGTDLNTKNYSKYFRRKLIRK